MRSKLFALWLLAFSFVPRLFAQTGTSPPDVGLFNKAVACIKEAEGWHGNHLPYVGYGHNYPNLNIILTFWCKYLKYNI